MSKQIRQGFPARLRQVPGDPDAATEALLDAIKDRHPRLQDESRQQHRERLMSIALQLVREAGGAFLVRTADSGGTND